jgi:hypothetical protein
MMVGSRTLLAILLAAVPATAADLVYDTDDPLVTFAAAEIAGALTGGHRADNATIHLELDPALGSQAYAITGATTSAIRIRGGDSPGLLYGGLELAEQIRVNQVRDTTGRPHIEKRGLKFNIPLDIRTPSYQDAGHAAQNNIAEMWNFDFWRKFIDDMARHRYNVLTLWNPHPFPSLVKLDDYPEAALDDVWGTTLPLDDVRTDEGKSKFIAGCGVSREVLDNAVVLKRITIDEKIEFWRRVMRYARDRGVEVHWITWNIWFNSLAPPGWYRKQATKMGERGKYGINNDQENPRNIPYLRASIRQFLLTYPDVAGIGLTAGENMEDRDDEFDREKWLWNTHGQAVMDVKKLQPEREVRIIHRVWNSGMDRIMSDFIDRYDGPADLSFKYARARVYSSPDPPWADEYTEDIRRRGIKSWWNIRNDDIFHFRWGDPDYVREFIRNLPPADVTAGYYFGSDSYVWGRESMSLQPNSPRDLEIRKHWYSFLLWGRMGYDPDLGRDRIEAIIQARFREASAGKLYDAWAAASKIIPQVNRFHWQSWDFQWAVEGCLDLRKGFHTVEDFIGNPTMDGQGILTIPDYVGQRIVGRNPIGQTPEQVAQNLNGFAAETLRLTAELRDGKVTKELSETLADLTAMAHLGNYYAEKIRGALNLAYFRATSDAKYRLYTLRHLQKSLDHWKAYAAVATASYRPQILAKTHAVDWDRLTHWVINDIALAKKAFEAQQTR